MQYLARYAIALLALGSVLFPALVSAQTPGMLDASFGTGGKVTTDFGGTSAAVRAVAVQPDGKIVAAGGAFINGVANVALARYNRDGTLDTSFGTGGTVTTPFDFPGNFDTVGGVVLQPDGKIVLAGSTGIGLFANFALARYNSDGTLDTTFGTGGMVTTDFGQVSAQAYSVAVQADGKIVAAGYANVNGGEDFALARYNSNGTLDATFGTGGKATTAFLGLAGQAFAFAFSVAIQPDGRIVAAGYFSNNAAGADTPNFDFAVARYNSNGTLDTSFGAGGKVTTDFGGPNDQADSIAVQPDGRIVVAGAVGGFVNRGFDFGLARYNSNGTLDASFGTGGKATTHFGGVQDASSPTIALQGDGKIVVVGQTSVGGNIDFALARYNTNGTLDTTFGTGGQVTTDFAGSTDAPFAVALQTDGNIVVAGFAEINGRSDFALARYVGGAGTRAATATTLASSLNPSTTGGSVAFTATVTGTNPTGTVNFKDGANSISSCSAIALSGSGNARTATCATAGLGTGAHSVTAAYSGDATNAASTSAALTQTVNNVASTTGIATSLTPSLVGSSVTFTATVSGNAPTGSVNFKDGSTSITGCSATAVGGSGNVRTATCATSSLTAGTHSVSAAYSGDGNNNASTSAALSQVVNAGAAQPNSLANAGFENPTVAGFQYNPGGTGVGWVFSTNSGIQANGSAFAAATAPEGKQTAFIQGTATISQTLSLNAGSYTLSLNAAERACCVSPFVQPIKVTLDGVQVGSLISPASTSFATFTVAFSVGTSGTHTIAFAGTASGDKTTFIDAVTLTSTASGTASATTTTVASSLQPSTVGAMVTFTATVTGSVPTGTVAFNDGGVAIAGCVSAALGGSGNTRTATCATSALAVGTHSIVASFGGDAANAGSTSATLSQMVNAAVSVTVANPGFEIPALSAGTFQYRPTATGIGWTFVGGSGIESNGSAFGAAAAADGKQAAIIQGTGSVSQTLSLSAGSYTLSFKAAERGCCVAPNVQPIKVTLDGVQIGNLVSPASTSFVAFAIPFSVATSGAHTLAFTGTDSADKTTFIDSVSVQ